MKNDRLSSATSILHLQEPPEIDFSVTRVLDHDQAVRLLVKCAEGSDAFVQLFDSLFAVE